MITRLTRTIGVNTASKLPWSGLDAPPGADDPTVEAYPPTIHGAPVNLDLDRPSFRNMTMVTYPIFASTIIASTGVAQVLFTFPTFTNVDGTFIAPTIAIQKITVSCSHRGSVEIRVNAGIAEFFTDTTNVVKLPMHIKNDITRGNHITPAAYKPISGVFQTNGAAVTINDGQLITSSQIPQDQPISFFNDSATDTLIQSVTPGDSWYDTELLISISTGDGAYHVFSCCAEFAVFTESNQALI